MSYHTKKKPILLKRGRNRKRRPKTFKTSEAAKKWAEENKIKSYVIVNTKSTDSKMSKFKVVEK
ncbi:hypothetical protein ACFL96_11590 [Thermoproteota archaeon]